VMVVAWQTSSRREARPSHAWQQRQLTRRKRGRRTALQPRPMPVVIMEGNNDDEDDGDDKTDNKCMREK